MPGQAASLLGEQPLISKEMSRLNEPRASRIPPVPLNTPGMAQEMQISLPTCGCTWLGVRAASLGQPGRFGALHSAAPPWALPGAQQGSVESTELIPSRNNLGLEEIISGSENSQGTPQPCFCVCKRPASLQIQS